MYTIITVDDLRAHLGLSVPDDRLLRLVQAATAQVERLTGRHYLPRYAAITHPLKTSTDVPLKDDLLHLESVTSWGVPIPLEEVERIPDDDSVTTWLTLTNGPALFLPEVTVTGVWGWHNRWSQAWQPSDDQLLATLDATSPTLTVADGSRFAVGQTLRIESEYLRVVAVTLNDPGADTLTVMRGVGGTTAASHALNTPVEIYHPAEDVAQLVMRWATWLYREPDGRETLPEDLLPGLNPLRRP